MRINAMLWMIGDYARLGAAYFCLGCDLGCILSGICCGAWSNERTPSTCPAKKIAGICAVLKAPILSAVGPITGGML